MPRMTAAELRAAAAAVLRTAAAYEAERRAGVRAGRQFVREVIEASPGWTEATTFAEAWAALPAAARRGLLVAYGLGPVRD